jgi:hypothetical protein
MAWIRTIHWRSTNTKTEVKKLAVIFSLLTSLSMYAQQEADRTVPPAPKFFTTTIPVRCLFRDYNIGMGWRAGATNTIEVRAGWMHHNYLLHENLYEGWFTSTEMLFHGPSLYAQANRWKMKKSGKRTYVGLIAGYRYLWFHDEGMWMGGMGGSSFAESITLSQWRNDVLLLVSKGWQTSKVSTFEVSVGVRLMFTHTNVTDTRFHFDPYGSEAYENYKRSVGNDLLFSEGFGILPLVRFSSRLGKFEW